jgi:mono/diheme cytochrome c family protein
VRKYAIVLASLLLAACVPRVVPMGQGMGPGMGSAGTAWGTGAFDSNGERIYFTATSERGTSITYSGGPDTGMMMGGTLTCASCHGPDGRGGRHTMHMDVMDAPAIRWSALTGETDPEVTHDDAGEHTEEHASYTIETFQLAVAEGQHPEGKLLDRDMPRWNMTEKDLADLADCLISLP